MAEKNEVNELFGEEVRLHPILTNDEYLAAQKKARDRVEKERRTAAMQHVENLEVERLRIEEGMTTGIDAADEIVHITIDLPPYCDKLSVNGPLGKHYWNGKGYDVPRHVANTLAEMSWRAWRHEDQVDGKSIHQTLQRKRDTMINARTGFIASAPARFDA